MSSGGAHPSAAFVLGFAEQGRYPVRGFVLRCAFYPQVRGLTRGIMPSPFQGVRCAAGLGCEAVEKKQAVETNNKLQLSDMRPTAERPLVTIIVPSFNQGRFIKETLDSILSQDYRPLEVLVLDGGSTDQTVSVLESYKGTPELKWWSEKDNGVVDAVNKGLALAKGDIIAIQSSDDVYLPRAISAAAAFFSEHPEISLAYGHVEYIDEHSEITGREILPAFKLNDYLGRFTYIPQPSAFFRAEVIGDVVGWREEVSYAADADFWMRIALHHGVGNLDSMIARYRYHSDQRDAQRVRIGRDWERTIRDLLVAGVLDKPARRFAKMGIYLAKYRYCAEHDWLTRTMYLYRAAAANPRALLNPCFPKRELFFGREPIWKVLSRIKRYLGFRPRTSAVS